MRIAITAIVVMIQRHGEKKREKRKERRREKERREKEKEEERIGTIYRNTLWKSTTMAHWGGRSPPVLRVL